MQGNRSVLQVKRSKVKEMDRNGKLVDKHYMDIAGPILPHNLQLLRSILDSTQQHYFIQCHELTSSFNQYFQTKQ